MPPSVTQFYPAIVATMLLSGVAHGAHAAGLPPNWEESGQASWYGPGFDGKLTSSGDVFDQHALTAAHDTLPLGTKVRVTVQTTGRSVVVTITDRMPPKHLRIIDLARGAAKKIGLISKGVGMVTLTEAQDEEPIEVAEALEDAPSAVSLQPRGPRHTHPGAQTVSARHGSNHAPSEVQAQR